VSPETRRATFGFAALLAFALASWAAFRGYLTPDMLVYFLSFKWCL
jgi:hypothetical protein